MEYQASTKHDQHESRSRSVRSRNQSKNGASTPEGSAGGIEVDQNGVTVIGKHDITPEADKARVKQMTLALVNQARVIVELKREVERLRLVEDRAFPNRRRVREI